MIQSTARIATANAGRYVLGLCRQWGDRIDFNFGERQGIIHFEGAVATLTPHRDQLVVTIVASDFGTTERLQNVVASNLDRLAEREGPLSFDWDSLWNFPYAL